MRYLNLSFTGTYLLTYLLFQSTSRSADVSSPAIRDNSGFVFSCYNKRYLKNTPTYRYPLFCTVATHLSKQILQLS